MDETARTLKVFLSYSHRDEKLRQALSAHLAPLKRSRLIQVWDDREISGGLEFNPAIATALQNADLILLLVSSDFLNSEYAVSVELKTAMVRHESGSARVLPIILRPCYWQSSPFGKLLAAPRDGKPVTRWPSRDEGLIDVVETIRRVVNELATRRAPITKKRIEWRVQIHDSSGAAATTFKATTLTANEPGITSLVDEDFASTGKLTFVSSSLCEIRGPMEEGGILSVITLLREPLPVGETVTNTLTIRATDTFTAADESFRHIVTDRCRAARISIELPAARPAISACAFRAFAGRKEPLPAEVLSSDKLRLEFEAEDPPVGAKYILEWRW